jgi:hypothetical protein
MADEPSGRALWNVKVGINFMLLIAAGALMWYGVTHDQLSVKEALQMVGGAVFGGGLAWLSK